MLHTTSKQSVQNGVSDVELQTQSPSISSKSSEVLPRATRRRFSVPYKLRIIAQADGCSKKGAIGSLLRGEGLYSSHLSTWRTQKSRGELGMKKRGRPAGDPSEKEVVRLRRENERLKAKLEKSEIIIDVQKKLSSLLGIDTKARE